MLVIRRGWRPNSTIFKGVLLATVAGVSPAMAQTSLPQGALPTPQQVTPPTPDTVQPSSVRVDSRDAIVDRPCPFDDSPLRLTLNQVSFVRPDGSALQPEIAAAIAGVPIPTGDQSVRVICEIRDAANAALRRGGWVGSVQVPAQEINGGTLRLNIVTARLVDVRVRGSAGRYEALLRRRIEQLKALDPLNEREAERLLLLTGDLPGLDVQLSLRPAPSGQGDVIGELTLTTRRFAVLGNVQNYNSRQLGRETGYVRAELYGLTGLGDITYVGLSSTADFKEQRIAQVGHIMTLDDSGTTLGGRFSYAWSRPDLGILDFRTDTLIAGIDLTHPLVRRVNGNLGIATGFDFVNQKTDIGSGGTLLPLTRDRLRVAYASIAGDARNVRLDGSTAWRLNGSLELRKGVDIFKATDAGFSGALAQSRVEGDTRAFVARFDGQAYVGLGRYIGVQGDVQAQWTKDPLVNYEEYSIGNLTIGRGYDPGSNSADRAVGLRGEVHANVPPVGGITTQLFGFYDAVTFDNLDTGATETGRWLRSYGGGARFALPGKLLLEITYAHPKDRALTIDARPPADRLLVSLSFRFRDRAR